MFGELLGEELPLCSTVVSSSDIGCRCDFSVVAVSLTDHPTASAVSCTVGSLRLL